MPKRTTTFGTSKTPTKNPQNGHFTKGQWLCNCQPRLPAVQFQVHRESPNKGRWFYTCQHDRTKGKTGEPARCDFFLWAEDARLREEGAILNNTTTEPGASRQANGGKTSLRTPRKLVQTTLSARVEPREEGKRHWTHRTEIMPINDLERAVNGSPKKKKNHDPEQGHEQDDEDESAQLENARKGKAKEQAVDTARSSSTFKASNDSKTATSASTHTLHHDHGVGPANRDDEDELAHVEHPAAKSTSTTTTAPREQMPTAPAGSKRKRDVFDSSDDDDLFEDMDSEEERQLVAITDSSGPPSRTRDAFITPTGQRTTDVLAGMPTPSLTGKTVRRVLFSDPVDDSSAGSSSNKRQRNEQTGSFTAIGAPSTPSSSQEGAGPSSSPATPGTGIENITEEIMGLLKDQNIEHEVQQKVRSALRKFMAQAKGLEKGRDATRQALKTRDSKIAHLQMQIVDLENKRKLDYEARKEMRNQMMQLYTKF